ncbi:MAG: S41 family peptidase, partial [Armatimonadota bacterium]
MLFRTFDGLTKAQRIRTFETIWSRVKTRHWDARKVGANWDAVRKAYRPRVEKEQSNSAFYTLMQQMVGELGQSHFGVIPPEADVTSEAQSVTHGTGWHGMHIRNVYNEPVVVEVERDSPAAQAGVKAGWVIEKVGDTAVRERLKKIFTVKARAGLTNVMFASAASQMTKGPIDTAIKYAFRDASDKLVELDITCVQTPGETASFGNLTDVPTTLQTTVIEGDILVIRFNIWLLTPLMAQIREAILGHADAKGMIIDLRGNPGGVGMMASGLAGMFMPKGKNKLSLGDMNMRASQLHFAINPQPPFYRGPIAVLIDEMSLSTSEVFAGGMQDIRRAVIVGRTTGGMVLPSNIESLDGGLKFQYAIADFKTPKGVLLEARGVIPDVPVRLTRQSLNGDQDPMITAAVKALAR